MAVLEDVVVTSPRENAAVVELTGEHDMATSRELADLFESLIRTNELVVVDLSEAQFVDSSVLSNLLSAYKIADDRGKVFRLQLGTRPIVKQALEISGILRTIPCVSTRVEALGSR